MSVSLYDLLDVEEDATADEIRAAWKTAIADLDPTDRRFRAFNDAAGVLLDEEKRAAYDAELAAARTDADADAAADADDDLPAAAPIDAADADEAEPVVVPAATPAATEAAPAREPAEPGPPAAEKAAPTATDGPPTWALLVAAAGAVLSVALAIVVLAAWPGSLGGDSPAAQEENAEEAEAAAVVAEAAAEDAVPAVLSYDYRTLDEDFAEAEEFLTDEFAAKRTALFEERAESGLTLREQVVSDKVVVTAAVAATGLTRVASDGDRATIVVYVNQDSQKGEAAPRSLRMWATLSMVAEGDDWLLDDICTESNCG